MRGPSCAVPTFQISAHNIRKVLGCNPHPPKHPNSHRSSVSSIFWVLREFGEAQRNTQQLPSGALGFPFYLQIPLLPPLHRQPLSSPTRRQALSFSPFHPSNHPSQSHRRLAKPHPTVGPPSPPLKLPATHP
ncbi:hypothetical protein M5K25_005686 [Dendrobium thyrsiflorum]|uniref:Uncharacterized protein n=1 Tax=Dendrobium thyrsiflorum TaxID=117978 RepID=A0ABD0VJ76_DENTH